MSAKCGSCGADIVWVKSRANGKRVPLDARMLTIAVEVAPGIVEFQRGRQSHFATCPNAAAHREPREPRERRETQAGTPCAMCTKPVKPGAAHSVRIGAVVLCGTVCAAAHRAKRALDRRPAKCD